MNLYIFKRILVVLVTALLIAGCAGGNQTESSSAVETIPPQEQVLPTAVPPAAESEPAEPAASTASAEPAPQEPPAVSGLDGKSLAESRCSTCHSFSRVSSAGKSADGWTQTVQRMVSKGAVLTAEEELAVVQYLSETYP